MSDSAAVAAWERMAGASSMIDVLAAQEGIDGEALITDLSPLVGDAAPEWLQQLAIPPGWEPIELPGEQQGAIARLVVAGPRQEGGWEAVEILNAFAYTGYASFHDIADNAACTLRDLGASGISSRMLPVPPVRWAAAVRAEGVVSFGSRDVFSRQSNYLAGSEQPHAGRLIIHSVMVDVAAMGRWSSDIETLSAAVHDGFVKELEAVH